MFPTINSPRTSGDVPNGRFTQIKYNPMTYGLYAEPNNGNTTTKDSSNKFMTREIMQTRNKVTDLSPR